MQFPKDVYLTEDKIEEGKFQLSKLFKLPDKMIVYNEIIYAFEAIIKEKYPVLDYILKNLGMFINMQDFYIVLEFSNQLFA